MDVIEGKIEKLRLGYNWPLVQEKVAKYKRRYLNSSALEWVCQAEQMVYSVIIHTDYRYDDCPSQPWIHIPQFPESNLRVVLKSAQSEPPVNSANELAITVIISYLAKLCLDCPFGLLSTFILYIASIFKRSEFGPS
jgi:hypothetical protein